MSFKNKPGFSLIEAMFAITIIGLVLTPMFILENNVFNGIARMAETFHRLLFAQNFLYSAQRQEPPESTKYSLERKEDKPLSMARYTLAPIAKQSSLGSMKHLYQQRVEVSGLEKSSPKATMIQCIFKPERPS